jgi:uncharacterized protein (TIGR03086 family)
MSVILTSQTGHMLSGSEAHHGPMATKRNDPRVLLAGAMTSAAEVIGAVTEDQLDLPTPCSDFDVRTLANHLLSAPPTVASLGRGDEYGAVAEVAVPFDQWREHWAATAAAARAAWDDDALLGKVITLPWAELPGGAVLAQFTGEIVVHTWTSRLRRANGASGSPRCSTSRSSPTSRACPPRGGSSSPSSAVVPVADDAAHRPDRRGTGRQP